MESSQQTVDRLKIQLAKLVGEYQKTLSANIQLEKINEQLTDEVSKQTHAGMRISQQNALLKTELESVSSHRSQQFDGHQNLKDQLSEAFKVCRSQQEEIARLKRKSAGQRNAVPRSSGLSHPDESAQIDDDITRLKSEIKRLETDLFDSYDIIDELEFEVEQIAFLEAENERLTEELRVIRITEDVTDSQQRWHRRHGEEAQGEHGASESDGHHSIGAHLVRCQLLDDDEEDVTADNSTTTVEASNEQVEPSSSRKLVKQPQTVSSRDAMRASTTLPSPSTGRSGDGGHFSRSSNVSVRRRGELHKKLESLHERQSVRSGSLLDRFRQELPGDLPSLGESTYDA